MKHFSGRRGVADGICIISFLLCLFSAFHIDNVYMKGLFHTSLACLVAGLADWFAVRSLFGKPLGIGFHTAVIPRSRDRIIEIAKNMVTKELLSVPRMYRLFKEHSPLEAVYGWIYVNRNDIENLLTQILTAVFDNLDMGRIQELSRDEIKSGLSSIDYGAFIESSFDSTRSGKEYKMLWNDIFSSLSSLADAPVTQNIIIEAWDNALSEYGKKGITNGIVVSQILSGERTDRETVKTFVTGKIKDSLAGDSAGNSEVRFRLVQKCEEEIRNFLQNGYWKKNLNNKISKILSQMIAEKGIKTWESRKDMAGFIAHKLIDRIMESSHQEREAFSRVLLFWISGRIETINHAAGKAIEKSLSRYSGEEMADMLKGHMEEDLEMIRINGSFIGAVLGCFFYIVSIL